MNIKAEDLSLYQCYKVADPVIGWAKSETVIVLGKYDEVVGVSFLNGDESTDNVFYVSNTCLFKE